MANETKWTKAPWLREGRTVYALHGEPPRNRFFAAVQVGNWRMDADEVECEANARLIAAAPDLYLCALAADEALSNACDPVKDSNNPLEVLRWNLRAALAKARGE